MDEKKKARSAFDEELDKFWDIDSLIPQRRPVPKSQRTDTVEITLESPGSAASGRSVPIPPRSETTVVHSSSHIAQEQAVHGYVGRRDPFADQPAAEYEYEPQSALLHRVEVFRWKGSYQYYEEFVKTAEKLQEVKGTPCENVKFFSYVPQYSQMTRAQLAWYLYFRDLVRAGCYPQTDYSYVLLLVYEIINLADRIPPAEGQELLWRLWENYRKDFPQLDNYLAEWICDYSLIHRLPPPRITDRSRLADMIRHCGLKEFYVEGESTEGYVQALLTFCSNHDYRKSKFYTEESRALFESSVNAVMHDVVEGLSRNGRLFSAANMPDSMLTRDAYSGALCSYRRKRKLRISYCSFSRSHELRFLITDVLKHVENKLRAHLGIRSRLTVYSLPDNVRGMIDRRLEELLPRRAAVKKTEQTEPPEYERLYDLPSAPLDPAKAEEIERLSWGTTKKLVEAFEEESAEQEERAEEPAPMLSPAPLRIEPTAEVAAEEQSLSSRLLRYAEFLRAADRGDAEAQRSAADAMGRLADAVADEINEIAADALGDVLLEEDGSGGYCLIEDYRDALEGLL